MKRILMIDLSQREAQERAKLGVRRDRLEALQRTADTSGGLGADQEAELTAINAQLDSDAPVDPFFRAVASAVTRRPWDVLAEHREFMLEHGLFGSQQMEPPHPDLGVNEQEIAFVCGLLELDNCTLATAPNFVKKITEAQGEYRQNIALFNAAYETFARRFDVTLQSQIDKRLVDGGVLGSMRPGGPICFRTTNGDSIPGT